MVKQLMIRVVICLFLTLTILGCTTLNLQQSEDVIDTGEVSFKLLKGAIIVPVKIEEVEYNFVLDTGGYLTISSELRESKSYETRSTINVSDISKALKSFETVSVESMEIGNWLIEDKEAIVSENYTVYPNSCFSLNGMIGRNLLKDVYLDIDYASMTLRITNRKDLLDLAGSSRNKMKISKRGLPSVRIEVEGKSKYIEFDSGSNDWFSYQTSELEKRFRESEPEVINYEGIFSFGFSGKDLTSESRYRKKVDQLIIGDIVFEDSYSDLSKATAPRLGSGLIKYGRITIDYIDNYFYYKGYGNKIIKVEKEPIGFSMAKVNGDYIIKWVEKGSEADKKGLKYGDRVEAVNDIDSANWSEECELYLNNYDEVIKRLPIKLNILTSMGERRIVEIGGND